MEDPVFSYLIIKKLEKKINNIKKIYIFDSPKFSIKRMVAIMMVMGVFAFIKHCFRTIYCKIIYNGKVYAFAESKNIPCEIVTGKNFSYVNSQLLKQSKNSLLLSIFCNYKIPNNTLRIFNNNAVNIHLGKIPEYKGILSIFYSLLDGNDKLFFTIHRINQSFDSGNIISSGYCKISNQKNIYQAWKSLCIKSADQVISMIKKEGFNIKSGIPISHVGKYFSIPSWRLIYKFFIFHYLRRFF